MAEIGGILGAGAGLVGAALSAQAQQTANVINWMNLQHQKQSAAKQMRFAQAARGDAYGNKQSYDDLLNEWKIALTPTQEKITKAGEAEQLRSLTEDAKRNRDIKKQQRLRGIEAGKDYNRVLADFRYGGPKSELAIRDELTNLLAGVEQERSGKEKTMMLRAAMREGRGTDAPFILKGINDASGQTLAANMLNARQQAGAEFASRTQQHQQRTLPILQELQRIMDMGGDSKLMFSDTPDKLLGLQEMQAKGIQSAFQSEASNVGDAYKNLAASSGKSPDFSGIAKSLAGIGGGGARQQRQREQAYENYEAPQQPAYSVLQNQSYYPAGDDRWTNSYGEF